MNASPYTNKLIHEKSPYLLQHAHNPVDWYPWGSEAFEKAKKEDKPIFLSIGYSTCHWCHVMERESFEEPYIAKVLNENFISIKVDREERPDLDNVYMAAVQTMTGAGGWPMSVFLTHDLKPFYGGTYFPPEDRWGRPGFVTVLVAITEKWKTDREKLFQSGEAVMGAISAKAEGRAQVELDQDTLRDGFEQFESQYDSEFGGFGNAPKFPRSHALSFLLRWWKRTQDPKALEMVEKTLSKMARGGINDHLGRGFHRYSVDRVWRISHFEKMLYDQAILSKTYLEAYQATGKEEYAQIARDIFEYVLRDMTPPPVSSAEGGHVAPSGQRTGGGVMDAHGALYSAEDADSAEDPDLPHEKSEGAFYLWKEKEVIEHLGEEKARIFNLRFGIRSDGNAIQDPQGEFVGKNVLYIEYDFDEVAERAGISVEEVKKVISEGRKTLFEIRSKRPRPHLDDKVLTDWNGLMISSLAFGSRVLKEPRYREAAQKAADFILQKMKREDGRLMHRYRDNQVSIPAFLEDYAFFSHGLFDLYEATFDPRYLEEAKFFTKEMIRLFWDEAQGGFFFTGNDVEKLISRNKELYDGAIPSGNSVATLVLLRVARLTMDRELESYAKKTLDAFSHSIAPYSSGYPQMLIALDFALGPSKEILLAGDSQAKEIQDMVNVIYTHFIPCKVVTLNSPDKKIGTLVPFAKNQKPIDGKPTAYVCQNYVCQLPTTDVQELSKQLTE